MNIGLLVLDFRSSIAWTLVFNLEISPMVNAVVAIRELLSCPVGVGAVGVPVNAGLAM